MVAKFEFLVEIGGARPSIAAVAEHLWGPGVDFDSDGNSVTAEATNWTELTVAKRPDCEERVDVDPASEAPLILKVVSASRDLAARTATFLAASSDGRMTGSPANEIQTAAISERLWRAAERWPSPNRQELDHLEILLSRLAPSECFAVLVEPFSKEGSGRLVSDAQEYAGRLLLRLKPMSPYDVGTTLRLLLLKWDVSVEQIPWYLEATLGTNRLLEGLAELQGSELSEQVADTVKFWLRVPSEDRL